MAALLRKSKSVVQRSDHQNVNKSSLEALPAADLSKGIIKHLSNSIRRRSRSRGDFATANESERIVAARQQQDNELSKQHSITQLRRRLVRKASTFNLHSRHHNLSQKTLVKHSRSNFLDHPANEAIASPSIATAAKELEHSSTTINLSSERANSLLRVSRSSTGDSISLETVHTLTERNSLASCCRATPSPDSKHQRVDNPVTKAQQDGLRANELVSKHLGYRDEHIKESSGRARMAAPIAEPPLPYDKLKHITVDACDATLSSTTTYDHSKTEFWNTTIINTILSQLVGETTPAAATTNGASAPPSQSKWKFVVNSTIIQHRSNAVEEAKGKTTGGRRGMHSAAGAYWNNEKDGMWSFKYEAAEKMGLDVIVGIVWVWVG